MHACLHLPTLFLVLLPLLSILGTQLVNLYQNNLMLLILIPLVALVPILIAFDKIIPKKLFSLAVITTALALLYHTSLISMYLYGADVNQEYYFANLVKINSFWDSTIPNDYNAVLSIVMLAPIYSSICGINLIWVFKIVYPLLFSLVPLVLYQIFKKQTDSKTAFLAAFFFMSVFTFFTEMLNVARQQTAEIFLVLIILLIVNKDMNLRKRATLVTVFGALLAVSHYALAYIFMCSLLPALFILFFFKPKVSAWKNRTITTTFVALYFIFVLSWYIYVSGSATFNTIIRITDHIVRNIFTEFFNPEIAQGLHLLIGETVSPVHEITKALHIVMQLFITVAIFKLVLRRGEEKFDDEYVSFSLVSFVLCLAAVAVPYLASYLNTSRLYHVTLLFLAPFCIVGAVAIFKFLSKIFCFISTKRSFMSKQTSLKFLSIILGVFLLFNSGFMYEVTKSHPSSVSLSQNWIKEYGNAEEKLEFYNVYTPAEEVVSAGWLSQYRGDALEIYSDFRARNNVLNSYAMISRSEGLVIYNTTTIVNEKSYIYFRKLNIVDGLMGGSPKVTGPPDMFDATTILSSLSQKANKIYSNGGSEVYYTVYIILLEQ